MAVMTNTEFVKRLKNIAQNYKTLYVMGCFGAPLTGGNVSRYCSNHSYNKAADRTAMIKAAGNQNPPVYGFDCVCLIKGVLWGWSGDSSRTYGGADYAVNGVPDIGADTMITKCQNVSTSNWANMEIGEALWCSGHIGIYIGDGLGIECSPRWENKVQITAVANIGSKSGYNTRTWTKHGKLPYISYEKSNSTTTSTTTPTVTPTPTPAPTKVEVKGIDVSKWQGNIDWAKVKAAGIKFAMIRLGFGGKDGAACGTDGYFDTNVQNALKAGIDIGCYFYSYAKTVEQTKAEAAYVINVLKKYPGKFTYPIAFDLEDNSQVGLGKTVLTNMVIAFCDALEKAGYYAALYSNTNWLANYLDDSKLTRFDHWLAQWASKVSYKGAYGIWQYSSKGSVSGINGNVDMNIAYKDYPTLIKGNKLNGFTSTTQTVTPTTPSTPTATTSTFKVGDKVKIKSGAKSYTGKSLAAFVYNNAYTIDALDGNRAVLDKNGICTPVNTTDLIKVEATSVSLKVGDKVKVKSGAKTYTGGSLASFVYTKVYLIRQIEGNRVVIAPALTGAVTAAVKKTDLIKQ